jgi:hypothetical protein
MTTGAKVAIILGSATLLIGGGIGVYFLTRKKETTISTGGGSSTTTSGNKVQDTAKKVGDTANTLKDTTEAIKGLGSAIGGLFKKEEKKEETASTGTLKDGTTIFTPKQSATGDDDVPTKMSNQQMLKTYGMIM